MPAPLLILTNAWPDFPGSYHGIFVRRAVEDLIARGWPCHVLAPRLYRRSLRFERHERLSVTRFPFPTAEKLLIEYERPPLIRLACLVASGTVAALRVARQERCGLIHAHWAFPAGLIALAAARILRLPLVLTVHGSDQRLAAERGGIAAWLFRTVARSADRVHCVSTPLAAALERLGVPAGKILTRPMGVDLSLFHPAAPETTMQPQAICTRNLLPLYRVGELLAAAALAAQKIPELRLTLAGEGRERAALEARAEEKDLAGRVTFTGRLEQPELARLLAAHPVYLSASPAEGASLSLLEAMACGCLPVVTDIPANRDWVEDGVGGLLFPPEDVPALAAALERAFTDRALRERAARLGPALVAARGSREALADNLERIYRELIGEPALK